MRGETSQWLETGIQDIKALSESEVCRSNANSAAKLGFRLALINGPTLTDIFLRYFLEWV